MRGRRLDRRKSGGVLNGAAGSRRPSDEKCCNRMMLSSFMVTPVAIDRSPSSIPGVVGDSTLASSVSRSVRGGCMVRCAQARPCL